jgi:hypothetical protein
VVWATGLLAVGLLAWRIGSGMPIPGAEEREDANLIATRPGATVGRWIVAHVDTKAQGHSMAGRLVAAWLLVCAGLGLTTLAVARWVTGVPIPNGWVMLAAGLALVAGALASRGKLRGTTPGARDNGTGLLAACLAAERVTDPSIGFLFTGAEEFGLIGARVVARSGPAVRGLEVLNLDTLDDRGDLAVVSHDRDGRRLGRALLRAGAALEVPARERRMPLGIFVDSYPLARAGAAAVTIARLNWATLRRIHTAGDTAAGLDPAFAERLGRWIATLPGPGQLG